MPRGLGPSEAQIELAVLDYLVRARRLMAWKNQTSGFFDTKRNRFRKHISPYARNGVPDIICVIYGLFVGFEVKKKGNGQTESQISFESDLRKAGGLYYLVRSVEEVDSALLEIESKVASIP